MDRSVDVKSVVQEIRLEIEANGYTNDMLGFTDDFDERLLADVASFRNTDDIEQDLATIDYKWNVPFYRPLFGNKLTILVKRIVRKLNKFQLFAILNDQNTFNRSVARILEKNRAQEAQIANLCDRISALEALVREDRPQSCQSSARD